MNHTSAKLDSLVYTIIAIVTLGLVLGSNAIAISTPILMAVWLVWVAGVAFLIQYTRHGRRLYVFFRQAYAELLRVVWPTRQETVQTTAIVMVMVTITGFALWLVDSLVIWLIARLTHIS